MKLKCSSSLTCDGEVTCGVLDEAIVKRMGLLDDTAFLFHAIRSGQLPLKCEFRRLLWMGWQYTGLVFVGFLFIGGGIGQLLNRPLAGWIIRMGQCHSDGRRSQATLDSERIRAWFRHVGAKHDCGIQSGRVLLTRTRQRDSME
jgi:hypothetical protein